MLEISDIETRGIILSRQRTTKVLVRLRECAGGSAPLLFAHCINRFINGVAQMNTQESNKLNRLAHSTFCEVTRLLSRNNKDDNKGLNRMKRETGP